MLRTDLRHRAITALKILGVAALYALLAHASHLYVMSNGNGIGAVWPSSGLALAAILIGGKRYAWSAFIGSLLMANVMAAGALVLADITIATGNALAALLGAGLFMRSNRLEPGINSLRDFLRLILLGGCAAGMVSALFGNTALLFSGFIGSGGYFYNLIRWWMGDVLGVILVTPLILSWRKIGNAHQSAALWKLEFFLLLGLMFFIGQIVFLDWYHDSVGSVAKVYWTFLLVVWVAVRLGIRGVTVALCMTAIQALWGAYYEVGFFEHDIEETQLVNFWFYMVALSVVGMALAAHFTQRRLADAALRRSEAKLRSIYDSTSDAVMLLDDKAFFECNSATLAMFGCETKEAFCSKHPADLSPPAQPCGADSMELANRQIATAMKNGRHQFEWEHRRADTGKVFSAEVLLNRMALDGKMVLQATVRDISGRKQIENTLRKLSLAVEQSSHSIVITDLDANIEYVNWAFVKETGFSFAEAIGRNPRILNSGKNTMETYREMWSCLTRGGVWKGELVNRRRDGSEYVESVLISPVRQNDGQITHYLGIKENIVRRKTNEGKIERLGRAYHLLSRVNEAIVRAQNREGLFASICDAAMEPEIFRFVWIGMLDEQKLAVTPVAHAGVEEGYTSVLNIRLDDERTGDGPTGRAIRTDTNIVCDDIGSDPVMAPWRDEALKRGYRSVGAFPLRENGIVVGTINAYAAETDFFTPDIVRLILELAADVSFALDVFTERKRREQAEDGIRQLNVELEHRVEERTRQLEDANKELEAFSYSVSHDLRAPLRSIDGFSRTLSKKYHDQLDDTGKDWLERICRSSQHMGRLIDDMLKLSQVTRGALKRDEVDLSKMAGDVADGLRKTNPERQVRFFVQQGLSVQADSGLLHIVMDNLLGNAWKYSGKKAEAEIEFGMRVNDGEAAFFVRDNGAGFNMEYARKLFGAFQRLHTTNEFEGTGIGLATVQRVIHRHNGKVWAESREGQGATFYFTLPQRKNRS